MNASPDPTNIVGRRTAAFVIDLLLISAVAALLFFAFASKISPFDGFNGAAHTEVTINDTRYAVSGTDFWLWVALTTFVLVDIAVILEGLTGATPGKALIGIRVVDADGQRPGMLKAFLRLLAWVVDGFFCYLVAFVTALSTRRHQRVGDFMAGTFVVRLADVGRTVPEPVPVAAVAVARPVPTATPSAVAIPGLAPAPTTPPLASGTAATPAPATPSRPRADWYPDPTGEARLRYWDGGAWTNHTAP
jgi:uncharacterized RDD family membrane protein YckC